MLTTGEIDRIAAAANALRPDWPVNSLRTLLAEKLAHRTRRDVMVALAWVACDSTTITPARVLEAGPWWFGFGQEARVSRNPRPDEECPEHLGQFAHACSSCTADNLAGTYRAPTATATKPPPEYLAARRK